MTSVPRRCRDCGREKPAPVIPLGAGPQLSALLQLTARLCLWCFDRNLLAGGFYPWGLRDRWSEDELAALFEEADREMHRRGADWRLRRQMREREEREKDQGSLLAGPSAQREADVA